jgi:hypothetical protein
MKANRLAIILMALVAMGNLPQADAKPAYKAQKPKTADGVVVTKNADGTVEVTDQGSAPAQDQGQVQQGGGITYRPAPPATIKYADGVTVKRNADGSVEVMEQDSGYQSFGAAPAPTRRYATKRSGTRHVARPAAKKTK